MVRQARFVGDTHQIFKNLEKIRRLVDSYVVETGIDFSRIGGH
jgi:hypothetical protein